MKHYYLFLIAFAFNLSLSAQENLDYQKPPKEILDLVDVPAPPYVLVDSKMENMVALFRKQYKSIEELSQNEMRLAGLRIDPKTNIGSRSTYWYSVKIKNLKVPDSDFQEVIGLPENAKLTNFKWSHNQKMIAMTNTTKDGVEIWILDIEKAKVSKLTEAKVNSNMGSPFYWFKDDKSLLVKMLPEDRKDLINKDETLPEGPTVSVNDGKKAQNRTYQDLLEDPNDEFNFEQLARSTLFKLDLKGKKSLIKEAAMYRGLNFSPDGEYILISEIKRPFSYLVPYSRFPYTASVFTRDMKLVQVIEDVPLIEDLPQGFAAVRKGRRDINWRTDKPSTLHFTIALDEGDPEKEVDFRDELFELVAPFDMEPRSLIKTINRFGGVDWANDTYAIASDWWWTDRNTKSYVFNPSDNKQEAFIIFDRNWQDRYNDPGSFVTEKNTYNESIIAIKDGKAFLTGDGFSDKGQFPFLDKIELKTGKTERMYQSEYTDKIEELRDYNLNDNKLLVRIESANEFPNYYFRSMSDKKLQKLTNFENPFKGIEGLHKEVIKYKREDGVELSATLYLPLAYDTTKKEKVPMILWAYPDEYKDKQSAGQNTKNPNEFTYLYWGSPIYWTTRGYAVLDDASMPIIGEGDKEPNDAFRKQLVLNAKAAIDAVDQRGYIDPKRVAVGGHSYGAFMVANLLSHSDLFAAGIARSGAYNRTLTPFGFQSEERNYWEAPEVYYTMSPFMHADKMKTPLLLIHGKADNNSGTYPMQSERYFNALKGLGATVRLVMLPKESHGYRAEESIYHMLWEQDQWLEKYLKEDKKN